MSGLFTAAFLRQIGWDADVYERSTVELVGRGAGITTHPELLEALQKSGAGTRDLGVEVEKRITLDRDGRVIGESFCRRFSLPGTACSASCARPLMKRTTPWPYLRARGASRSMRRSPQARSRTRRRLRSYQPGWARPHVPQAVF